MIKPFDVEGVESDKVEFKCQALGVPLPRYSWVDKEGIDVRQKEGDIIISQKLNIKRLRFFRLQSRRDDWNYDSLQCQQKGCGGLHV